VGPSPIPLIATYRVQFTPAFGFEQATELVSYLKDLGVSHLYSSPYLMAAAGSAHGYNVVDPGRVNPELGGKSGHRRCCEALSRAGIGQILDIVPNHMAIGGRQNRFWWDVLRNGPAGCWASFFDIRWESADPKLHHKVLLPILGAPYGRCLEDGHITLRREGGELTVRYYAHEMPVAAETEDALQDTALQKINGGRPYDPGPESEAGRSGIHPAPAAGPLPGKTRGGDLRAALAANPALAKALDQVLAETNADPERVDRLLEKQHYRLAFWRTAARDINYRRFFDIDQLAGIRVESETVFIETHRLVLDWVRQGVIDGLRIDHPDGLRDPAGYLRRLRDAAPAAWIGVEKILEPDEHLPADWPVAGTTGYDFLNQVGGLFVDPAAEPALTRLYRAITGQSADFPTLVRHKKHQVLAESFPGDIERLTDLLLRVRARHRNFRDLLRADLGAALNELAACFPVYRTYARAEAGEIDAGDLRTIAHALELARTHRPDLEGGLWDLLAAVLGLQLRGPLEAEFVMRFQQLTGPVMAKGVEDTAFYNFNRLISLNEVGGDPTRFGVSPRGFHADCALIQAHWPQTLLTTSTHDTKRGEDTRLRISLLSEIHGLWSRAVRRWFRMNAGLRRDGLPDANTEYFLYQTLVGTWPIRPQRLKNYMKKSAREAKVHTSWRKPDPQYEAILQRFVEEILEHQDFVADLTAFLSPLMLPARMHSLAQTLIRCTAPGVPDLYQGAELWDETLVDPDNRRPVDFELRRRLLAETQGLTAAQAWSRCDMGLPKLFLIQKALAARSACPEAFGPRGTYTPLYATGGKAGHVMAFQRGGRAITIVPRLLIGLGGDWGDTRLELPPGTWLDVFTGDAYKGGRQPVARFFGSFPVSLLIKEGGQA